VVYAVNRKKERVITKEIKAIKFKYLPTIVVYYKKKEIGRIVGCSREMVGRVLKTLEEQGLVMVKGKTMVVYGTR